MDIYQLDYILHEPEESEGWMYLAEVPALQGCMAWGDTPEQTLDELRAVAKALIQSRQERGVPLPPEVTPQRTGKGSFTVAAWPTESCAEGWNGSAVDLTGNPAGPTKCGSIQQTSGKPPSPGTETVTWPLERSTESAETWESPGQTLTRHSPLRVPSLRPLATPPSTTRNARQMQTSKERVSQFSRGCF